MGEPVDYIERTASLYRSLVYEPYRWVHNVEPPPFAPLRKPVRASRLGLVASGGIYVAGQVAFHHRDDTSLRIVPTDTPLEALRATHFAYDLDDSRADPNVVFPVGPLRRLVEEGELGELAPSAYTFMGGIYSARRVRELLAPEITRRLVADQVDLALLVPV